MYLQHSGQRGKYAAINYVEDIETIIYKMLLESNADKWA